MVDHHQGQHCDHQQSDCRQEDKAGESHRTQHDGWWKLRCQTRIEASASMWSCEVNINIWLSGCQVSSFKCYYDETICIFLFYNIKITLDDLLSIKCNKSKCQDIFILRQTLSYVFWRIWMIFSGKCKVLKVNHEWVRWKVPREGRKVHRL